MVTLTSVVVTVVVRLASVFTAVTVVTSVRLYEVTRVEVEAEATVVVFCS